jgi:three-Cys-motif partner protein
MMPSKQREDTIGRWSLEKLELLRKYLASYLAILGKQPWCEGYEYIDAFAGSGRPKTRDAQRYVDGSPRVALSLQPAFTQYHFIEQSYWRVKKLTQLIPEFPDRNITIYHGDSNSIIKEKILPQLPWDSRKRAFAFVDPFGMQMDWQTMERLAEIRTVEIILNFPAMAINRSVRRSHPERLSEARKQRLDRFWGAREWMVDLFEEDQTLFGPEKVKRKMTGKESGHVFKGRLEEIFPHCTNPILIANSKGAPLYCLMFAGHNATGKRIAEDIFASHEKAER